MIFAAAGAHLDRRIAEGKTSRVALPALKRDRSNAVYRQLVADARTGSM